jgi:hypothetical protein
MSYPKSRADHLRVAETDDGGVVIYDQTSDDGHVLNATAATVYQLADGTRSIEAITAELAARTRTPAESDLVLAALYELNRVGLLEDDDTSSRPALDRRRFLAKIGLMTGAAALLPLIETITRVSQATPLATNAGINQPRTTTTTLPQRMAPPTGPPSGGTGAGSRTNP